MKTTLHHSEAARRVSRLAREQAMRTKALLVKWWPMLARFVVCVALCWPAVSEGQTYVRPSVGASVSVFSADTTNATSSVFNWSAFREVQLTVDAIGVCTTTQVRVQSSVSSTGTFATINDPFGARTFSSAAAVTYSVVNTGPYIRFTLASNDCTGGVTLTVVPVPFQGQVRASGYTAAGSSLGTNPYPVIIGGSEGTTARTLATDSSGRPVVVGAGVAGTPAGGVLTVQGDAAGTPIPVTSSGTGNVNLIQVASSATGVAGTGASGAGTQRVVTATDSTIGTVTSVTNVAASTVTVFPDNEPFNMAQVAGTATAVNSGNVSDGTQRVREAGTATLDSGLSATGCTDVVATAGGTTVLAASATRRTMFFKNQSTVFIYCMLGDTPTTSEFHFALRPGTVAADSLGDGFEQLGWTGTLVCIAASDPGTVNICGVAY